MPIDPRRPALPRLPVPSPRFLPAILDALPFWALITEQQELRRSLAGLLLAQGPGWA